MTRGPRRRLLVWALAAPLLLPVAYGTLAFALALWPGRPSVPGPAIVEAYVISNGVHTDLVLPVRSAAIDWTAVFPPGDVPGDAAGADFVAIGWGDREFYLNTPEWRDLTAGRAIAALSGAGRSLLHVTWLRRGELGERTWVLPLDGPALASVIEHVKRSMAVDATGRAIVVPGRRYTPRDAFYEARGAYDAVTTCNTWTGRALRDAGAPVGTWTPFADNVTWHLQRARR